MKSKADMVKGHGVLSAHDEQVALVREVMKAGFEILENAKKPCQITQYHSLNPEYYLPAKVHKKQGITVGMVHFLPETVENSIQLPSFAKSVFYKYMISFYKQMDYLVTVNPCFIDALKGYGIPEEKVTYIPNYVSEEQFYPLSAKERRTLRGEYELDESAFVVLCAGQLQKRKGVLDYIELAKRLPQYEFLWAGGFSFGKISDGYEEIKKALQDLPSNLHFLGMVDRDKMNGIYNMADVFLLPSYEELFPMTILEAMSCHLPVVVRDLSLYEPILHHYVQKGKNIKAFQELLTRLQQDPQVYLEACHASAAGSRFYSREHVGSMWKQFYCRILMEKWDR
jgi:1,2-diacylglycerol-3-alpha-glucose alpha-1,2-galactosyltransferase